MVRYPFDLLRAVSEVEPLTTNGKVRWLRSIPSVRPEVYPPSAAPEATREFRITKFDGLVRSQKTPFSVIPAEAGIQEYQELLDPGACPGPRSGIRLGDGLKDFLREHQV